MNCNILDSMRWYDLASWGLFYVLGLWKMIELLKRGGDAFQGWLDKRNPKPDYSPRDTTILVINSILNRSDIKRKDKILCFIAMGLSPHQIHQLVGDPDPGDL